MTLIFKKMDVTKKLFRLYIVTCFSFLFCTLYAQTDLTLSDAIAIGLQNNYQVQISEKNEEIARNNNNDGTAGRYPIIDFNLSSQNSFRDQSNPSSFIPQASFLNSGLTGSIDGNWTIFDGFKVRINKKRLEELELQSQGNTSIAVENSIRSIILAYYQALIQREQLEVFRQVLDLSRDRIRYQEVRKEFGQAGKFDVLQVQDAYLNDSTSLIIQENSFDIALQNLKLAMGVDDRSVEYRLVDALDYNAESYVFEDLQKELFDKNKNLQNLLISQRLADIETEFQESNRYPRVGLGAGLIQDFGISKINATNAITMESFGAVNTRSFTGYLNLSASYNLYDGGNRKRGVENAKVQEMIADLNIEDLKRRLSTQLYNTLATYNNQIRLLQLTDNLVENSEENLRIAEERFKAGKINSFDFRSIQLGYINASQSKLTAIFNLKNTETDLIQLIGGLVRE